MVPFKIKEVLDEAFPGKIVESVIGDGAIAEYSASMYEILLGFSGIAITLFLAVFAMNEQDAPYVGKTKKRRVTYVAPDKIYELSPEDEEYLDPTQAELQKGSAKNKGGNGGNGENKDGCLMM